MPSFNDFIANKEIIINEEVMGGPAKNNYQKYNYKYPTAILKKMLQGEDILTGKGGEGKLDYSNVEPEKIQKLLDNIQSSKSTDFDELFPVKIKSRGSIWSSIYKGQITKITKGSQEVQERGLVKAITDAINKSPKKSISVTMDCSGDSGGVTFLNVTSAKKVEGVNAYRHEPYADIAIISNGNQINISCKDFKSCPSKIGGGLLGLLHICKEYIKDALIKAYNIVSKEDWFKNQEWHDIYFKLDNRMIKTIFVGNEAMGGPIHYIYEGAMEITSKYDAITNELIISSQHRLINAKSFSENYQNKLYVRIRRRNSENSGYGIPVNTDAVDANGIPYFSMIGNKNNRKINITDDKPNPKYTYF